MENRIRPANIRRDTLQPSGSMNPNGTSNPTAEIAPTGALVVDFDSVLGEDRLPFDQVKLGTTVTATVTVRSITPMAGGHARGIVDGEGGYAIFYIARDFLPRLTDVLTAGATVKIRGTAQLTAMLPTIDIFAARQVDV